MEYYQNLIIILWTVLLQIPSRIEAVPASCNPYVDLLMIVDASESVVANDPYGKPLHNWSRMRAYLSDVVRGLPVSQSQHRVAMMQFSTGFNMEFLMDQMSSAADITSYMQNRLHHSGGNTNTGKALEWGLTYIASAKRSNAKGVVLIFTDGVSQDAQETQLRARLMKDAGIEVFTVSLDDGDVDGDELYQIATTSYHRIIAPNGLDQSAWEYSVNQAVYGICDQPVPPRDPICSAVLDIALVIDNSGSIKNGSTGQENYRLLKQFVTSLLDTLDIRPDKTRVGAIRFSHQVHVEFQLDTYMNDKEAMKRHIMNMAFEGYDTNISGALNRTRYNLLNRDRGDRSYIPNVVIVIADGQSNINAEATRPVTQLLKATSTIYVVAVVTKDFHKEELEYIATDPDKEHYFESPKITTLPILKCKLLKHVCKEEIFSQCV